MEGFKRLKGCLKADVRTWVGYFLNAYLDGFKADDCGIKMGVLETFTHIWRVVPLYIVSGKKQS